MKTNNKLKRIVPILLTTFAMTTANADLNIVNMGELNFIKTDDQKGTSYAENQKEEENITKNQCDTYNTTDVNQLVSDFIYSDCYSTAFPYFVGGMQESDDPKDDIGAPPGSAAAKDAECTCGEEPYEWVGVPKGIWLPIRVVEIVRGDGSCSPTQGNNTNNMLYKLKQKILGKIGLNNEPTRGNEVSAPEVLGFKHFHSWKVDEDTYEEYTDNYYSPSRRCFNDQTKGEDLESSVDYAYWSSNNPLKANLLYPEYALAVGLMYKADKEAKFPVTAAMSAASCLIQTTGKGVRADDFVYWQGGCYPDNLPANGHFSFAKSLVDSSQLILQRSVMFSGRRGVIGEHKDAGYAYYGTVKEFNKYNICFSLPNNFGFPMKSHYKFSMLKPFSEVKDESNANAGSGNSEIDQSVGFDNTNKTASSSDNNFLGKITQNVDVSGATNKLSSVVGGLGGELGGLTGQVTDWAGASTQCAHRWGANSMRWGTGRNPRNDGKTTDDGKKPTETKNKDAVYIVWRWVECCEPTM